MEKEDLIEFLHFRKKFTTREWFEIGKAIEIREKYKADKIVLDDLDLDKIIQILDNNHFLQID